MKKKMRISTPRGNTPTSHGGLFQPWPMLYRQTTRQKSAKGTDQKYEACRHAATQLFVGFSTSTAILLTVPVEGGWWMDEGGGDSGGEKVLARDGMEQQALGINGDVYRGHGSRKTNIFCFWNESGIRERGKRTKDFLGRYRACMLNARLLSNGKEC